MSVRWPSRRPPWLLGYRGAHSPKARLKRTTLALLAMGASFALLSPPAQANPDCLPAPSGVVAWWPGDGDTDDIVGGRDGTATNGATFGTGKVGQAFLLDGTDDYINIPHDSVFDFTEAVSIEAWIKADTFADQDDFAAIVTKGDNSWRMQRHSNSQNGAFGTSGLSNVDQVGNDIIDNDVWHHLVAVWDGPNDDKFFYVDGVADASDLNVSGSIAVSGFDVQIGRNAQTSPSRHWEGLIDEVTLYNRALSAAEVAALHAADEDGKCKTATTLTPTRFDDPPPDSCLPADCSLREAVIAANGVPGTDTIDVPAGTYNLTIGGRNEDAAAAGDLDITEDVTIMGEGATTTIIDANDNDRILHVLSGTTVDISDVTIRDGTGNTTTGADPTNGWGGGIYNTGSLTLTDSIVTENTAENDDPEFGQGRGAGMYNNAGTLELDGSSVTNNTAPSTTGFAGGIFSAGGTLTLTDSEVSGNTAGSQVAGIEADNSALTITSSTISGNNVIDGGAALAAGIAAEGGSFSLINSTVSGNFVTSGSAFAGGIFYRDMSPTITNSTIADNTGNSGAFHRGSGPDVTATNVLVSGNSSPECNSTLTSAPGNNLESGTACFQGGDLQTANADLGALAYNGGPTQTHALNAGSYAIDAGTNTGCPSTDQRGAARSDSMCDIGAYEYGGDGAVWTVTSTGDTDDGTCDPMHCTLREAISLTNASAGADVIEFDIPGSAPQVISPASALPTITDPVTIDGYTQDGAMPASNPPAVTGIWLYGGTMAADGFHITAGDSTIRGFAIFAWSESAIELEGPLGGNDIEGNYIGTREDAANPAENGQGVFINGSPDNTIGGTDIADRNIISNNNTSGVNISGAAATGNKVQGNYIGTDDSGNSALCVPCASPALDYALGNGNHGVYLNGSPDNLIGGSAPGAGNVVSGNDQYGVKIEGAGATGNMVEGNHIGIGADGSTSLRNNFDGLAIVNASDNDVGDGAAAGRNVISSNTGHGVYLAGGSLTTGNTIAGNYIGTDATGELDRGNGVDGVRLDGAEANYLGGVAASDGNVISGNGAAGIRVRDAGSSGNEISSNLIGTEQDGVSPLANGNAGVLILDSATDTTIGGAGEGNTIAFGDQEGVRIVSNAGNGHSVRENSIHSNASTGLDLGDNGVLPNDAGDGDNGPNSYQNYPVIDNVSTTASTTIEGTLNSNANTTFDLDFYYSSECDPSGHGEGETFLGSIEDQTTDGSGNLAYSDTFATTVPDGDFVTATATGPSGTSEFSACALAGPLTVNSTGDSGDDDTTDFICDTSGTVGSDPECTLRAAIEQANENSGDDDIEFDIPDSDGGCAGTAGEKVCTIS
ncbi:MAG: LamG-like jellyroll fold domain-containing protein, partial [Actinomycetota bacterium]